MSAAGARRWRRAGPARGVVVLGMHRSGTSAATRLLADLGLGLCPPGDRVRGPWNPNGHYESRTLMHLDNDLLRQMGCTWWYPPPAGPAYGAAAARLTTTPAQARRVFRRVHGRGPWVWKDPRAAVLVPLWRAALGPRLAALVVVRNPLEVALSLQRRHGVPPSFGVALWERYNRLLLEHSAGLAVLVTRFDDLVADPGAWSATAGRFLASVGLTPAGTGTGASSFVDPGLRHARRERRDVAGAAPRALPLYDALLGALGPSAAFVSPPLDEEDPAVQAELDTVGPGTELPWHPPSAPAPTEEDGTAVAGTEGAS